MFKVSPGSFSENTSCLLAKFGNVQIRKETLCLVSKFRKVSIYDDMPLSIWLVSQVGAHQFEPRLFNQCYANGNAAEITNTAYGFFCANKSVTLQAMCWRYPICRQIEFSAPVRYLLAQDLL